MSDTAEFHAHYVAALQVYLDARDEDSLAVGQELGRRARFARPGTRVRACGVLGSRWTARSYPCSRDCPGTSRPSPETGLT